MDRTRFSHIGHTGLRLCNPASSARVDRAIDQLALAPGSSALDIGAGKCEWLARIATRFNASCTAVEPARVFAADARQLHAEQIAAGYINVIECGASEYFASHPDDRFDATLCVGSSHALGGYKQAIGTLLAHTRPGGRIVLGEGYWRRRPEPAFLEALGGDEHQFVSHSANIRVGIDRGCVPLWCSTVTDDEWDEYEWTYSRNVENFVREHPSDPDAAAMLARSRKWRDTVLNGGRDTLGFGLYVFRVAD